MTRSALRWERQNDRDTWGAYSGDLLVAMVVLRRRFGDDGTEWAWRLEAVSVKWLGQQGGEVARLGTARRAVERNWQRWLDRAGLIPVPEDIVEEQP